MFYIYNIYSPYLFLNFFLEWARSISNTDDNRGSNVILYFVWLLPAGTIKCVYFCIQSAILISDELWTKNMWFSQQSTYTRIWTIYYIYLNLMFKTWKLWELIEEKLARKKYRRICKQISWLIFIKIQKSKKTNFCRY